MADIPGLIEGASIGKGLGTQFLKHIERTKILVFIIDLNSENVENEYSLLCNELKSFDEKLLNKPKIILLSKLDLIPKEDVDLLFFKDIKDVIKISSVSKVNIDKAINLITKYL